MTSAVYGCLILGAALSAPAPQPQKKSTARDLPAEVVKAWEEAGGAQAGWMATGYDLYGRWEFAERQAEFAEARPIPAFWVRVWDKGSLTNLPAPEKPFGLHFDSSGL
jgi:hypothetical protein